MLSISDLQIWLVLMLIGQGSAVSYNQPKLDPFATWNPNAITFANSITVGTTPYGMFINTNNSIYVTDHQNNRIQVWLSSTINSTKTLFGNLSASSSIFATISGDIYVDNGASNHRVDKWTLDANVSVPAMYVNSSCSGLFVDINDTLYCSLYNNHIVVKHRLGDNITTLTTVAGTGSAGAISNMLSHPCGIFVDTNFNLYVADQDNYRIQFFHSGQLNGTTVAGNGSLYTTIALYKPAGIVLDADGYLFIADCFNNRIVGSGPNGFRCLVGCWGNGSASNQLSLPQTLAFDSYGNMYVTDTSNNRIQKFILLNNTNVVSYNQPKFCSNATWNPNAITFANISTVGSIPEGIFISTSNSIYVADYTNGKIQVWFNESTTPTRTILGNLSYPNSLFVTTNGDIYVDNGNASKQIDKWTVDANISIPVMYVNAACYGLFVDISNTLYCSMYDRHQVIKQWLNDNSNTSITVAGTGSLGSTSDKLNSPWGIFVDINFDLYVADAQNNRVQRFSLGQSNGVTVAGNGTLNSTISLNYPSGIVLDADKYLFIVDKSGNRIVGSDSNGFRCLVGCSSGYGSASNQLAAPFSLSFDSYGNIFVTDKNNARIQKFILMTSLCNPTTVAPTTTITQISTDIKTDGPTTNGPTIDDPTTDDPTTDDPTTDDSTTDDSTIDGPTIDGLTTDDPTTDDPTTDDSTIDGPTIDGLTTDDPTTDATTIKQISREQITSTARSITSSQISFINQTCSLPKITLIPGTSTFLSPIQYRRGQDFDIISIIGLSCKNSSSILTQWTIKNCSTNCSTSASIYPSIITTLSELYIPARTLLYGLYELTLTVTTLQLSRLSSSSSVYVQIIPSNIIPSLLQLGTSMITSSREQDLRLDPGSYSIDPDNDVFNDTDWTYEYYCRIYSLYQFPHFNGSLLTIDDQKNDSSNPSCLTNRTGWIFGNVIKSSMTILSNSLQSNRTYQFMVYLENRRNPSLQATGYVLVQVTDNPSKMIIIGCVISIMCVPNQEFQLVNPTTQVALFSICVENCTIQQNITWNIYYGTMNSLSNVTNWTLFNQTTSYENIWFFGTRTSNLTSTNQLFLSNPQIILWRFEVVYTFLSGTSISSLDFVINQPPSNGSCSINPMNGTTSTSFDISCSDWFDKDGIKDYSLYTWTTDPSEQLMIAFSSVPVFQVQLPAGENQTTLLHVIIQIRDILDCVTQLNMTSVAVTPDSTGIASLISDIQDLSNGLTSNPIIRLLFSENQNIVGQLITSLSQQFNQINTDSVNQAISNGIPTTSISISPLGSQRISASQIPFNQSAMDEYNKAVNTYANVRDYLITFITKLAITTSNSIKLQASSLAQITQATNQLTRTTLMIATDRCHQLTEGLYSMRTRISFEDVQMAATSLFQCAANVLAGVNGPLQQRINVLNLDSSRASMLPIDYDTDLESEWSNPNLFADGNDFSWETIQKNRNIYYQKQLANQIINQVNEMISLLTLTLNIHLNIGQNVKINRSQVFMLLEIQSLSNQLFKLVGNAQIQLPENFNANLTDNSKISIQSMMQPLAAFGNSKFSSNTNLSTSISLSIFDQNRNDISIHVNQTHPIQMIIPRDPNLIIPPMILQNVTSINSSLHNQLFYLQYLNITAILPISLHFEIQSFNESLAYLLIYKFDQSPQLNSSINLIDGWTLFCPSNRTNESIYTYFINNQQTVGHQSIIFGLRELNSTEINEFCSNTSIRNPPITNERFNFTSNYQLRIYSSGCYYLDENNQWQADGLIVGPMTNHFETQCYSSHLTTFAGGFIVLPAPINWNYVFANADFMKNKTIYLTVICVLGIYLILLIYARFSDRKDLKKLGVTVLSDNHQSNEYFYQIIVFTGQRQHAGTKSNVHFILSGDDDETQVRTFADSHRQILQRGGVDAFVMAVPKSLGRLNYIRIWHDNTGPGSSSSWFLKYLIIRDLQTMDKFHFICQRWFAVEKDDGKIERLLPVAGELQKRDFSYLLSKNTYYSVSDGHLWFSIFSRPPSNQFTRVQRCTCCFVLLFISMFLNIMYYDLSNEAKTNNNATNITSLSFGSLYINPQQIIIGVIVEVFALIPSLLLVQIFRHLRSRQKPVSPLCQALSKINPHLELRLKKEKKVKSSWILSWWWIFVAYGLCIILVGLSILFVIARGLEFGDDKTRKWLASILSRFFSSLLLTQPLKIVCLAIFFAFFCRKSNDDDREAHEYLDDTEFDLDNDEEYLHPIKRKSLFQASTRTHRLNENEVAYAREHRLKEIQMWSIIREVFIYLCFISLLYTVTYSNRQANSYLEVNHLQNYFLNSRQADCDYTKISTIDEYWNWLENSFVWNYHAQKWYNGDPPRNLSGFINDKSNRLIGWATVRQLRIKSEQCYVYQQIISQCEYDYSLFNEDRHSYQPGWSNETQLNYSLAIRQSFQYQSSDQLDTYVYTGDYGSYSGGGYVYEFRGRLSDLQSNISQRHQLGWMDGQTRVIMVQLTLYNPSVQLFTSVTFLVEILSSGAIYPTARFEPISFYAFTSIFQLVSIILYMLIIVYLIWIEIQLLIKLKWKYLYQFWSLIEVGIMVCSWTSVGIYIWRYHQCQQIGPLFKETNGYAYINLQLMSYVNNLLEILFGFCCFFSTIKSLRLCRFSQRLCLFSETLRYAVKELLSFMMMFSIVFISFACLFYFLFISKISECSSLLDTSQMLFEMTLMKFDAHELIGAATFLGPFCFSVFIILVVFVCLSMFISIINNAFRRARETVNDNNQEIFSFMMKKFQRWTGFKKITGEENQEESDAIMCSKYLNPIERFPDAIDQLLDAIDRLYMIQRAERRV